MPTNETESFSARTLRLFVPNYLPLANQDVYRRHILAGERAEAEGIATLPPSQNARVEDLLLVHTPEYVEALRSGQPADLASTGGVWFLGCIDVSLSVLGAFLGAIDSALTDGVAGMLGGGGHHAPILITAAHCRPSTIWPSEFTTFAVGESGGC
jgi:acetoin utilization deacetylase AcuC-like enzyme